MERERGCVKIIWEVRWMGKYEREQWFGVQDKGNESRS
jgi:hypothetical protein